MKISAFGAPHLRNITALWNAYPIGLSGTIFGGATARQLKVNDRGWFWAEMVLVH